MRSYAQTEASTSSCKSDFSITSCIVVVVVIVVVSAVVVVVVTELKVEVEVRAYVCVCLVSGERECVSVRETECM